MSQDCRVQILLATYNGEPYISELIESVIGQDYQNIVLTIRDDGSTDNTTDIINGYVRTYPGKVICLNDSSQGGLGASRNFGRLLELVEGDYFMFCDQDDVWFKDKVSKSVSALLQLEEACGKDTPALVFTDLEVTDDNLNTLHGSFWKLRNLDPTLAFNYEQLIANNVISGCTMIFNKAAKRVASPIPYMRFLHDQWVGFHVAYYGKLSFLREPTLSYRQHDRNEMGAKTLKADYFFKKIFFFPRLWSDWRWLKAQNTVPVRLGRIVFFKLKFNIARLALSLKKNVEP
jgi:glycosyltransferase involved in cell wall biosynthesis